MSDSLDYLSYAEGSITSPRTFLTQTYIEYPSDGFDQFYLPNQSTRIEVASMSMNQFILPRTMKLVYHAVSTISTLKDGSPDTPPGNPYACIEMGGVSSLRNYPGTPLYGAGPHLGSVSCEIPGLSSTLSYLTQSGQSQRWGALRLLCSGDEGYCATPGNKSTFCQTGRAWSAGGRDLQTRACGVTGSFWRAFEEDPTTVRREFAQGGMQRYDIPISHLLNLADGASAALPLPYFTSGSSNLQIRVNWASPETAVVWKNKPRSTDLISYVVGGVSLQWSSVNVLDASILASLQSLFRGEVSLPLGGGMSIPVPMSFSHRAFRFASTTVPTPTASVSLRIPCNYACVNAVALCIRGLYTQPGTSGLNTSDAGLISPKPIISNLTLRIGTATYPARPISDILVGNGQTPRGLASDKWALVVTDPVDISNGNVGGQTFVATSDGIAAEMHKQSRGFFSMFDNDSYDSAPLASLFDSCRGPTDPSAKFSHASYGTGTALPGSLYVDKYGRAGGPTISNTTISDDGSDQSSPNIFIFGLQSLMPEMSLRERGYALSGIDLRSTSDIICEFSIVGTAPPGVNLKAVPSSFEFPIATSWEVSAALSATEIVQLLPSRTSLQASSEVIPSAASSVISGGPGGA